MAEHGAGERLARLLLPYRRREPDDEDSPGHELGWWFTDAPPAVVREALALVSKSPGERPNDQPPEEWLVAQAARRAILAGFTLERREDGPLLQFARLALIVAAPSRYRGLRGSSRADAAVAWRA